MSIDANMVTAIRITELNNELYFTETKLIAVHWLDGHSSHQEFVF